MTDFTFRPIERWLGPETIRRRRSTFRSGYTQTMNLLDRELRHLRAARVVIQLALSEADIRLDGLPRASARPTHPGVILAFHSNQHDIDLQYAVDAFDRWEDNLRAIALGLEALRKVDRYGVTKHGEQYRGWVRTAARRGWRGRARHSPDPRAWLHHGRAARHPPRPWR